MDLQGTENFLESVIDSVDLGSGGTLNFAEFLVLMVKQQGVNGVQRTFLSYDVDGSGSITREELKTRAAKILIMNVLHSLLINYEIITYFLFPVFDPWQRTG